jgi:hypothetical protein
MGKISNNLEKHGDQDVPAFSIPITGLMLSKEQLCTLMRDKFVHQSWYNNKRDLQEPMDWCKNVTIKLDEHYDGATVAFKLQDDTVLEFQNCKLGNIIPNATLGGLTAVDLQIQLIPGLERENLLLQEYQNREIKLSVSGAKVALKKGSKQQELKLPPAEQRPPVGGLRNSEATH